VGAFSSARAAEVAARPGQRTGGRFLWREFAVQRGSGCHQLRAADIASGRGLANEGRDRMNLCELLPDVEVVLALEPEELGLHILQVLRYWSRSPQISNNIEVSVFINSVLGHPQSRGQSP
jgi:hypothetical protein